MPRLVWISFILLIMMPPGLHRFAFHRTAGIDVASSAVILAFAGRASLRGPA